MHPQIESYLEQVESQLKGLTFKQRAEEVRELEQHLQALMEEGKERGLNENEAVQAALAQFGSSRKVGRELNRAVVNNSPQRLSKAFTAMTVVMMVQAVISVLMMGLVLINWTASVQSVGGIGGIVYFFAFGIFYGAVTVQIALLLRQLRPWAFWLALLWATHQSIHCTVAVVKTFSEFPNYLQTNVLFFLPAFFCLITLIVNRKTYLRMAHLKWSV